MIGQVRFGTVEARGHTDKNKIFLTEVQSGAVAKSYRRKGFLIYEKKANI